MIRSPVMKYYGYRKKMAVIVNDFEFKGADNEYQQ